MSNGVKKYTATRPATLSRREQVVALTHADVVLARAQARRQEHPDLALSLAWMGVREIAAVFRARLIAQEWRE